MKKNSKTHTISELLCDMTERFLTGSGLCGSVWTYLTGDKPPRCSPTTVYVRMKYAYCVYGCKDVTKTVICVESRFFVLICFICQLLHPHASRPS